jgi:hypothetical protein
MWVPAFPGGGGKYSRAQETTVFESGHLRYGLGAAGSPFGASPGEGAELFGLGASSAIAGASGGASGRLPAACPAR